MVKPVSRPITILAVLLLVSFPISAADSDNDFWEDALDNCPNIANANQLDSDADGVGNVCDNCRFHANSTQSDADGDNVGDVCDPPPNPIGEILGNDDEAKQACNITAFVDPNNASTILASTSVFDTGSDVTLIGPDFAQQLDPARQFFNPQPDVRTVSKIAMDNRNWGLQALKTGVNPPVAPLLAPEAEVQDTWIRIMRSDETSYPILIGAPFANHVYAYIDHTKMITVSPQVCPAVTFFSNPTGIPNPLFYANLQRFASGILTPGSSAQPTKGYRYHIRGMRFVNGLKIVESPASGSISSPSRFLYDTGNKTTQISTAVAQALGITAGTPVNQVKSVDGQFLNGYRISRVEIDATDLSYRYVIKNALVFVKPPPSGQPPDAAFQGDADANIGNNFFETTQVLFDGAGDRLGLFKGVQGSPVTAPAPPSNLRIHGFD